jgi:hypothetical protein
MESGFAHETNVAGWGPIGVVWRPNPAPAVIAAGGVIGAAGLVIRRWPGLQATTAAVAALGVGAATAAGLGVVGIRVGPWAWVSGAGRVNRGHVQAVKPASRPHPLRRGRGAALVLDDGAIRVTRWSQDQLRAVLATTTPTAGSGHEPAG